MAEIVVYIGPHWMDALSDAEIDSRGLREKFDRRPKEGDVVEVFEDGHFKVPQQMKKCTVIKVPGIPAATYQEYMEGDDMPELGPGDPVPVIRRRKRTLDMDQLPAAAVAQLRQKKEVALGGGQIKGRDRV